MLLLLIIIVGIGAFLYYNSDVNTPSDKYPSVGKISIKFEEYKISFSPGKNIISGYGSLQVKNDNNHNIIVKLKCDTNNIPNIGCGETTQGEDSHYEVTEIEGRKIDGDIINPHENKLLSFKVYVKDYPINSGNFMLKLRVFIDDKCPYYIIERDGTSTCSSEQNDFMIDESPIYLTIN